MEVIHPEAGVMLYQVIGRVDCTGGRWAELTMTSSHFGVTRHGNRALEKKPDRGSVICWGEGYRGVEVGRGISRESIYTKDSEN